MMKSIKILAGGGVLFTNTVSYTPETNREGGAAK